MNGKKSKTNANSCICESIIRVRNHDAASSTSSQMQTSHLDTAPLTGEILDFSRHWKLVSVFHFFPFYLKSRRWQSANSFRESRSYNHHLRRQPVHREDALHTIIELSNNAQPTPFSTRSIDTELRFLFVSDLSRKKSTTRRPRDAPV